MNKILILAAHPDDETLGCGGTINRLSEEGHKVHLLTFTDGESARGVNKKNRNSKLEKVSEILGIHDFSFNDFPDNQMDSIPLIKICKAIESGITFDPDIIFTHFNKDLNIDHQIIAKATMTVFRPQNGLNKSIYSYHVPSSTDYNPFSKFKANSYFKLNKKNVQSKLNALKIYKDEMRDYPHSRSFENIENLLKVWGSEVGCVYAEKFKLLREIK